jgi:hypothetical protein
MPDPREEQEERVAQLNDSVTLTLTLPATTEEWADELLAQEFDVTRNEADQLVVTQTVGGNCNAVTCARSFLDEVEEFLREGEVDPMRFVLTAWEVPDG